MLIGQHMHHHGEHDQQHHPLPEQPRPLLTDGTGKTVANKQYEEQRRKIAEEEFLPLPKEEKDVDDKEKKYVRPQKVMNTKEKIVHWWTNLPSVKYVNHPPKKTEYDARSLFILKGEWKIRKWICWLIEWKYFDQFITTVILMNSVMLACNDYNERLYGVDYVSIRNLNIEVVDTAFSIIFLLECVLKILGMGFFMHKKAYLRDTWNWLDFFVVTISVVCWMPGAEGNKSLKSLRTFRILRPLRSINSMPAMKAQIKILIASIKGLVNVIIFLLFVYCIFAIFGAHQFSGETYSRCRVTEVPVLLDNTTSPPTYEWLIQPDFQWLCNDDEDCAKWILPGQVAKCGALLDYNLPLDLDKNWLKGEIWYDIINFNNVPIAMITIFQCLTLENWTLVMYNYMDCNSIPISIFFFCFLTIFGSWFSMQLVLATIMDSFAREQMEKKFEALDVEVETENQERIMQYAKNFANMAGSKDFVNPLDVAPNPAEVNLPQINEPSNQLAPLKTEQPIPVVPPQQKKDDVLVKQMPQEISQEFQEQQDEEYDDEAVYEKASRLRAQKNKFLGCVYLFCTNPIYNLTVFILILGNTAVLAIDDYPQSLQKEALLRQLNVFFTFAFVAEMLIKILGLGVNNYVKDKFNLFDCFVVLLSLMDFTISNTLTEKQLAQMGSGLQAIRALRLLRILKLARSWTKLQDIMRKTLGSVKDIVNFGVLLALYLYIYALLGMEMFAFKVMYDNEDNVIVDIPGTIAAGGVALAPRFNYNSVFRGLITGFFLILFEDWPSTWYNFIRPSINQQDGSVGFEYYQIMFYFLSNQIFGGIIMLSLFTAILLQNFEPTDEEMQIEKEKKEAAKLAPKFNIKSIFTKKTLKKFHALFLNVFGGPNKKQKPVQGLPEIKVEELKDGDNKFKQDEVVESSPIKGIATSPHSEKNKVEDKLSKNIKKSLMFHYQLLDKKKAEVAVKVDDLAIIGRSLFIFSPETKIRIFSNILILHPLFDNFILALILISTVTLAFDSPLTDPLGMQNTILTYIDIIMSSFFYCECLAKIIALGFAACGPKSYIRNPWNILDFTIVSSALISMIFSNVNLKSIKTLRVLRVLRPLRLLNKNRGLKLAIQSLFNSIPNIVNLLFVMWFFMFLMSILGMTFFNGSMWICTAGHLPLSYQQQLYYIKTRQDCINYGGEWQLPWMHFDNLIQSSLSLISMQSTENWIVVTMQMTDAVGEELQPIRENNIFQLGFGMAVMVVLYMLFLNLFVGVVIESFNKEKEELSLNSLLRQIEKKWIDVQLMTYTAKPQVKINTTGQRFVDLMIRISQNPRFDLFIMVMILANTFLLAMKWYNQNEQTLMAIEYLNYIFSAIFTIEAGIKLVALGKKYFKEVWNIFDFIVVVGTWVVQIVLKLNLGIDLKILGTLLRTLRIGRIFRIVKRVKAISMIFQTLIDAIPAISSVAVLLLLLMFMYTIIGIGQFGAVMYDDLIDSHVNFTIYWKGMLLLMRCSTGEAWDELMMNYAQTFSVTYQCNYNSDFYSIQANSMQPDGCGNPLIAYIFFYSYLIIVSQIFLNLIIAIIIDSFLGQSDAFNLPINQVDVDEYTEVWKDFDPDARGYIDAHDLEDFIISLCSKVSSLIPNRKLVAKDVTFRRRYVAKLEIPAFDQFRKFLFHDVIQTMARSVCETTYNRDRLAEKKLAVKQQRALIKADEKLGQVSKEIEIVFDKEYELDFIQVVQGIPKLNEQIDALVLLKAAASKVGSNSQKHGKLDLNTDGDVPDVYTSKHFVYGTLIVSCWREYVRLMKTEEKKKVADALEMAMKRV